MEKEKVNQGKKEYTDNFLTEQGKKILQYILMFPGICSGDLAKMLKVKKNSMSNALDRLKGSQYALIKFETQGRNKLYYLTEWGESYTKDFLLPPKNGEQQNGSQENNVADLFEGAELYEKKAEKYISDLDKLNPEWKYLLYSFLDSGNECSDEEINDLMIKLLEILLKLFKAKNQSNYRKLLEKIPGVIVNEKIEQWIIQQNSLEPLWDMAAGSEWIHVAEFIDEIFERNTPFAGYEFENEAIKDDSNSYELGQAAVELGKFLIEARRKKDTKKIFYDEFVKKYPWCNKELVFYIAEKYITMIRNTGK
ncbi:helix-turn-helix transcriptional regulator [bacterium]|nr:helix-turn-helix transcriptional regulator [bacterium]